MMSLAKFLKTEPKIARTVIIAIQTHNERVRNTAMNQYILLVFSTEHNNFNKSWKCVVGMNFYVENKQCAQSCHLYFI